jgi:AAA family ATP:ADP antiporter
MTSKQDFALIDQFKRIKDTIFPIETWELKKFLPLAFMMMLTIYVYSVLRGAKDTILINDLGAEMISVVKLFGVLPSAIIFLVIYSKVANLFSRDKVFYIFSTFFGLFFLSYALYLYPNRVSLHIDLNSDGFAYAAIKNPLKIIEDWVICSFYIFSELWGSIMLSLLFWQFANFITPVTQAKRFYSLLGLLGQAGLIAAGSVTTYISRAFSDASSKEAAEAAWQLSLNYIIATVCVSVILLMGIYYWMQHSVLTDKRHYDPELMESSSNNKKKKAKLSLVESFKYIFTSKYIGCIAILVIGYGVSINLVEGAWKSALRLQFPLKNDYSAYMGNYFTWLGICTVISMLVGVNVLRRFSWFTGAILTPLILGVTGVVFFGVFIFRDDVEPLFSSFGISALLIAITFGTIQNVLSKAVKYSLFDPTKEMAYIPLDDELKTKGKAAVDVVGARFGKSGGALIQFVLVSVTNLSINDLAGAFFVIFGIIVLGWLYGVRELSREFEKLKK